MSAVSTTTTTTSPTPDSSISSSAMMIHSSGGSHRLQSMPTTTTNRIHVEVTDSSRSNQTTTTTITTRSRTFLEKQPYIVSYGAAISLFSPVATSYQLCRLYRLSVPFPRLLAMSMAIFPHQTLLKTLQMNASTPVREHWNPWAAFAAVGVLQGGVYGHCNVHVSRALRLGKTAASIAGVFRGSAFAAARDTLSQGIPFVCSDAVRERVLDKLYRTDDDDDGNGSASDALSKRIKHWTAVLSTSVAATYLSQGLHNCQIAMQADQSLTGYAAAVRSVYRQHGLAMFVRGAEARVGLLLVVNILNELLLKPAWTPIPAAGNC